MQDITLGVYYRCAPGDRHQSPAGNLRRFSRGLVRANLRAVVSLKTGIKALQEAGIIL